MRLIKRSDSVTKEQNQLGISRRAFMKTRHWQRAERR